MKRTIFFLSMVIALIAIQSNSYSQVVANAGNDTIICAGTSVQIGGNPTASGGTSGYTYSWSPATGLSSTSISNPMASPAITTAYSVTVNDGGGSSSTSITTVTVSPIPIASSNSPVCEGQTLNLFSFPNGATSYGWVGQGGFLSSLQNPSVTTSQVWMSGIWTVYTSLNGCLDSASTTVTVNPIPTVTANNPTICIGNAAALTASGGCTYIWCCGLGFGGNIITPNLYTTTTYTLTFTCGNGCSSTTTSTITVLPSPQINASSINPSCPTCTDGSISLSPPTNIYNWSNGQTTATINNLGIGNYSVTITDFNGCNTINSFNLGTGNCSANFSLIPDTLTPHLYNATNLSYGMPPISYFWDWGDGNTSNTAAPNHTYGTEGLYNICLSITDASGCSSSYCDSTFLLKTPNSMVSIVVIDGTTVAVQETENNLTQNLSPNPFSTFCNLSFTKPLLNAKLSIYDNLGKEVRQITNLNGKEITIQKENLKSGMYFLKIEDKNGFVGNGKMVVE